MKKLLAFALSLFLELVVFLLWGGPALLITFFLFFLPSLLLLALYRINLAPPKVQQAPQTLLNIYEQASVQPLTIADLLLLSPPQFEEFCAILVEAMGMEYHSVRRVGGSGDIGIDIYALNLFNLPVVFQCKRYQEDEPVGSPFIQQFLGSITHYRASRGWFFTTSSYTKQAREVAETSGYITLLDGPALLVLIEYRRKEIYAAWKRKQTGVAPFVYAEE